jgi:integrase
MLHFNTICGGFDTMTFALGSQRPYIASHNNRGGGWCMKGNIYSDERCRKCRGKFRYDDKKRGLFCEEHPKERATTFRVSFGREICRRFNNDFRAAERFLTLLRGKTEEGTFDAKDYRKDNPHGFQNLAFQWLEKKGRELERKSYQNLSRTTMKAAEAWGNRNIKTIGYAEIEDFLFSQNHEKTGRPISDKTRANMRYALHGFWTWLRKRRVLALHQIPEFPEVSFELGFRNTVDKSTQELIVEEIKRISFHIDPKVWLGTLWLCTYISVRPKELRNILEKHINLENRHILIPHPKEKRPKFILLGDEDIEILQTIPTGFPEQPFFRHPKGINNVAEGTPYGIHYLPRWWGRACRNLGVEGVGLYGGTRHSSAIALGKDFSPEQIKRATMHSTNPAFERYFRMGAEDLRDIYKSARPGSRKDKKLVDFKR